MVLYNTGKAWRDIAAIRKSKFHELAKEELDHLITESLVTPTSLSLRTLQRKGMKGVLGAPRQKVPRWKARTKKSHVRKRAQKSPASGSVHKKVTRQEACTKKSPTRKRGQKSPTPGNVDKKVPRQKAWTKKSHTRKFGQKSPAPYSVDKKVPRQKACTKKSRTRKRAKRSPAPESMDKKVPHHMSKRPSGAQYRKRKAEREKEEAKRQGSFLKYLLRP
ncbi:DNA-binding protein HupB-like [Palaemon carinicauda]|uniref:DNA-binding protein HupB-like n=1 Tax=Palaemon carinicauda TaxID=392227 RepID=UPI0035B5E291